MSLIMERNRQNLHLLCTPPAARLVLLADASNVAHSVLGHFIAVTFSGTSSLHSITKLTADYILQYSCACALYLDTRVSYHMS